MENSVLTDPATSYDSSSALVPCEPFDTLVDPRLLYPGTKYLSEECITHGNFIIHEPTGEVVDCLSWKNGRQVLDIDDANDAIAIRRHTEAKAAGIRYTAQIEANAIFANAEEAAKRVERANGWWDFAIKPSLEAWTKTFLQGKQDKSFPIGQGRVGFKLSQGGKRVIKVVDMIRAIAWCRRYAKDAVKVEVSILVGSLPKNKAVNPEIFEVSDPVDTFYCETGIKEVK